MDRIEKHKYVQFTYRIADDEGKIIEQVGEPLNYIHGTDNGMFDKIENSLAGHKPGEEVAVTMTPEEGFGPHLPELTFTDDLINVPEEYHVFGAEVEMKNDKGETRKFIVSRIGDGKLTVDGNHPLAGKNLTFTLNIQDVRDATAEEIAQSAAPVEF